MQRDPLGYVDGMNLMEYVGGNVVNLVDPWGETKKGGKKESEVYPWYFIGPLPKGCVKETSPIQYLSQYCVDKIIAEEINGGKLKNMQDYYEKKYKCPNWPKHKSGITIGIGYDLGYKEKNEIIDDWKGFLREEKLNLLLKAQGLKGKKADAHLNKNKNEFNTIKIPYNVAYKVFIYRTLPKRIRLARRNYPKIDNLNCKCRGALISLFFNRGMDENGRKRMGAIGWLLRSYDPKNPKSIKSIGKHIEKMKDLWGTKSGLHDRRIRESKLFNEGFNELVHP